jgi:DNA repair protein RadC
MNLQNLVEQDPIPSKPDYLGHRARIRQKISKHPESLFSYELLEVLLFSALPRRDTKPIAKKILEIYDGSLAKLFASDFKELLNVKGISDVSFCLFKTIGQIYKKINSEVFMNERITLENFYSLLKFLRSQIAFAKKENFCEIFLNSQFEVIKYNIYDYGSIDEIAIYCKDIVFRGLECGAKNLIISHNHPSQFSGITPSDKDIQQTGILNELCFSLGIEFVDHVIVSGTQYFSFYSNGLL